MGSQISSHIFMKIVQASIKDKKKLDQLAIDSKLFWGYPDHYIKFWKDELVVNSELLKSGRVYKAIDLKYEVMGFFGLEGEAPDLVLEGFWVSPTHMKKGVGQRLFSHMIKMARTLGAKKVGWESDPNSHGFYIKMGAKQISDREYELDGKKRVVPIFELEI